MTEEDREKDKEPRNHPFSEEQVAFLRNLLEERGPSTTGQGKGKELAKKASKDAEKPGEYIGEGKGVRGNQSERGHAGWPPRKSGRASGAKSVPPQGHPTPSAPTRVQGTGRQ